MITSSTQIKEFDYGGIGGKNRWRLQRKRNWVLVW